MEIDFLRHFGLKEEAIKALVSSYGPHLLPLQERVISEGKLLDHQNLLVYASTSAGKTFLAELLFLHHVQRGFNTMLLVPTKALANQRYHEWKERYQPLGYDIVLSTRDHPDRDSDILQGKYHLAVVIYEKIQALLSAKESFLPYLGACVIDEFHYLYNLERGPLFDLIVTRLKLESPVQMLGLSAIPMPDDTAQWLGATTVNETQRPIELRQGVLCQGEFNYVEHNTGNRGKETFSTSDTHDEGQAMLEAALYLKDQGESSLLFFPRKDMCYTAARKLMEQSEPDLSKKVRVPKGIEESALRGFLEQAHQYGITVHTADLSPAERTWVEECILNRSVTLICATSTLAEGINIPVENVITTRHMYASRISGPTRTKFTGQIPISQEQLQNMLGRAGRVGWSKQGRGMIVTCCKGDVDGLMFRYAEPSNSALEKPNIPIQPAQTVLQSFIHANPQTRDDCVLFLKQTYHLPNHRSCESVVDQALETLHKKHLIDLDHRGYYLTQLGMVTLKNGLLITSAEQLCILGKQFYPGQCNALEILFHLCLLTELSSTPVPVSRTDLAHHTWPKALMHTLGQAGSSPSPEITHRFSHPGQLAPFHHTACKKALLLYQWKEGKPLPQLEKHFGVYSGMIHRLAEDAAWLLRCLSCYLACSEPESEMIPKMDTVQKTVLFGLPDTASAWFAPLKAGLVTRTGVLHLLQQGFQRPSGLSLDDLELMQPWIDVERWKRTFRKQKVRNKEANGRQACTLIFDPARPDQVTANNAAIPLTKLQSQLMRCLAGEPNCCIDYERLLNRVYSEGGGDRKLLNKLKNQIVRKLKSRGVPNAVQPIETVAGVGMVLRAEVIRS